MTSEQPIAVILYTPEQIRDLFSFEDSGLFAVGLAAHYGLRIVLFTLYDCPIYTGCAAHCGGLLDAQGHHRIPDVIERLSKRFQFDPGSPLFKKRVVTKRELETHNGIIDFAYSEDQIKFVVSVIPSFVSMVGERPFIQKLDGA